MGSTATIIEVEEDAVLAPVPEARRFYNGVDRNSLENRVRDAALRECSHLDYYEEEGFLTPLTARELAQDVVYTAPARHMAIVPLLKKTDYETRNKTVTVKLDGKEWDKYMSSYGGGELLYQKIGESNPELKGAIVSVQVVVPETSDDVSGVVRRASTLKRSAGWKVSSTVVADTTGGKAKTLFELVINGEKVQGEYETQAVARAEGNKRMKEDLDISTVNVTSRTVREDGSDLVALKREVASATAKVAVSYIKVTKKNPERDGFFVLVRHRD